MSQASSNGNSAARFDIRDHLDKLTSDGGSHTNQELSFHCPVCNAPNFKVTIEGKKIGQYFARGCSCMDTDTGKQRVIDAISPRWTKPPRSKKTETFTYEALEDVTPYPVVQVRRSDDGAGKRKFSQWHKVGGKWVSGLPEDIRKDIHLYRIYHAINQKAIRDGEPILIVEGEGKVRALHQMGIAATCSIGGSGKWKQYGYPNYLQDLEGAAVVICPDRDKPGIKHSEEIAEDFLDALWLYSNPSSFEWGKALPKSKGYDVADWINDGATKSQILEAIEPRREAIAVEKTEITTLPPEESREQPKDKRPQADQLLDLVKSSNVSLFITPDEIAYADIQDGATRRSLPLRRKGFRQWLKHQFYQVSGKSASSDAVQQAIDTLEAKAIFTGEKRETSLRVATHEDRIYIDLGSETWETVEISRDGWRIVRDSPVRFRRHDGMLPIPTPIGGGRLEDLKDLLHFSDDSWIMVLCFLLQCMKPAAEYPIIIFHGPPGAGKSSTSEALKNIIDPATVPLVPEVGDARNFSVSALNRHLIAIDNLSGLSKSQSDLLCTTSTGGGYTHRTLGSDAEETTFSYCRPVILNGIESVATMGDLLRRSFLVGLKRPDERISRTKFKKQIEDMKPSIFGALCDLLSQVLAVLPEIEGTYTSNDESFVEFVEIGLAIERVMNWEPGTVLNVFSKVRSEAHETAIDASPVGQAIQTLMRDRTEWSGTVSELLGMLRGTVSDTVWRSKSSFPPNSIALSRQLTRLSLDLQALGIKCEKKRYTQGTFVSLTKIDLSTLSTLDPFSEQKSLFNAGSVNVDMDVDNDFYLHSSTSLSTSCAEEDVDNLKVDVDKVLLSTSSKPLPRAGYVDDVDNVDKLPLRSPPAKEEEEVWKYCEEVETTVRVFRYSNGQAEIRVPGSTRTQWVDVTSLSDSED